jgi:transposase
LHPVQISQWKKALLEGIPSLFAGKQIKEEKKEADLIDTLYRQIGQLTVERDFLSRKYEK